MQNAIKSVLKLLFYNLIDLKKSVNYPPDFHKNVQFSTYVTKSYKLVIYIFSKF